MAEMTAKEKRAKQAKRQIRALLSARDRVSDKTDELDEALNKTIGLAYRNGVTAIELAELTGLARQNIYGRLRRAGVTYVQQPKKKVEA